MTRSTLALLLVAAALAGCSQGPSEPYTVNTFGSSQVKLVVLSDGTRCAIYVSSSISCDWQRQTTKEGVER